MSRTFVFGSEDWYKTIGYIFAGDDENTFSKEQIVDEIKYYYKKFEKDKINKAVKKLLSTSLADSLYANEGESRIKYEDAYKKRAHLKTPSKQEHKRHGTKKAIFIPKRSKYRLK